MWVRRHQHELPVVRTGRLVRFDSALLRRQFRGKNPSGDRLKTGGKMPQLQRYQRGYVYKTGKKQKVWYGMWREDIRTPAGQATRRQKHVRLGTLVELPTRTAAQNKLSLQMGLSGEKPSVDMNLSEAVRRWEEAVVPTIKGSTANYYRKILRANVLPHFGQQQISAIGRYDVEKFLAEQASTYTRNTLRGMRVSLGRVLTWAVDCGWLKVNPCSGVRLPRATGKRIVRTVLKPEQVVAIAQRLHEPYSSLVLLLAVTGLGIGEAIGIKWSDFDGDVLKIQRRIYEREADETKTEDSNRSLPIPASLLERLHALGGDDWIFRSRQTRLLIRAMRSSVISDLSLGRSAFHSEAGTTSGTP
jgi:hypothetical protein